MESHKNKPKDTETVARMVPLKRTLRLGSQIYVDTPNIDFNLLFRACCKVAGDVGASDRIRAWMSEFMLKVQLAHPEAVTSEFEELKLEYANKTRGRLKSKKIIRESPENLHEDPPIIPSTN